MGLKRFSPLLILASIVMLAGCESGPTGQEGPSPPPTAVPPTSVSVPDSVAITVQVATSDKAMELQSTQERIARFTAKYPNVKVSTDDWQYSPDQIGIKMAAHEVATEFNTYATEGRALLGRKWMADISDLFRKWDRSKDLNPAMMKPFTWNGNYYAVPQDGYITTVTLNKKLFRDKGVALPPLDWTWDDFLAVAKQVSDPVNGIAGFVPMTRGNEAGWDWTSFFFTAGGEIETLENGKVKAAFQSEAGLQTLKFYKQLKDEKVIPQSWVLGYSDAFNLFATGKGAMILSGGGNAVDYAIAQGLKSENLAVYPIPSRVKGSKHIGVLGGNYHVISPYATTEQKEWAFKFLTDEYFSDQAVQALEREIQEREASRQAYVPSLIHYWREDTDFDRKMQAVMAKYANVYHYDPELLHLLEGKEEPPYETQAFYAEITSVIQDVFTSKATDLQQRLDEAARRLQTEVFDKITTSD